LIGIALSAVICVTFLLAQPRIESVSAQSKRKSKPRQPTEVAVPDQLVSVADGTLRFRDLYVRGCNEFGIMSETYLQGIVVNDTPHTWNSLLIELHAVTKSGASNMVDAFLLTGFKPGESHQIGHMKCGIAYSMFPSDLASWGFSIQSSSFETTYSLQLIKPKISDAMQFEDESLIVQFQRTSTAIAFAIQNKLGSVVRIDWNQAAYVDVTGLSHAVTHQGVRYSDAAAQKPPTVIPPGARIEDMVLPADNVIMGSGDWIIGDLFPLGAKGIPYVGKEVSIYLPMEIGGKVVDYVFAFRIAKVNF